MHLPLGGLFHKSKAIEIINADEITSTFNYPTSDTN
jgi:hypothetical protein